METDLDRPGRFARTPGTSSLIRDVLVAVAQDPTEAGDRLTELPPSELEGTLRAGTAQGLGSSLVTGLQSARLRVPPWLELHRFNVASQRALIRQTLAVVAPSLTAASIPWVVLKGPVTAGAYESPEQREYGDLDILVPGSRLRSCLGALNELGNARFNQNWGAYLEHGVAEFPIVMSGTAIDMHWHLIGLAATRKRFDISMKELVERRQPTRVNGVECFRLDTVDNAIHLALHAGLSGAFRLGWLRDIDRTIRADVLDWRTFVSRSLRCGVGPMAGHVLDRCRHVMGTPVPPDVPRQLAPLPTLRARRWLDGQPPPRGALPGASFSGLPIAAARSGTTNTLGRVSELLQERVLTASGRPPRWSAYDSDGPLYWEGQSGGPNGLERYLEFAARPR